PSARAAGRARRRIRRRPRSRRWARPEPNARAPGSVHAEVEVLRARALERRLAQVPDLDAPEAGALEALGERERLVRVLESLVQRLVAALLRPAPLPEDLDLATDAVSRGTRDLAPQRALATLAADPVQRALCGQGRGQRADLDHRHGRARDVAVLVDRLD